MVLSYSALACYWLEFSHQGFFYVSRLIELQPMNNQNNTGKVRRNSLIAFFTTLLIAGSIYGAGMIHISTRNPVIQGCTWSALVVLVIGFITSASIETKNRNQEEL